MWPSGRVLRLAPTRIGKSKAPRQRREEAFRYLFSASAPQSEHAGFQKIQSCSVQMINGRHARGPQDRNSHMPGTLGLELLNINS